jgi:hypothetical protein
MGYPRKVSVCDSRSRLSENATAQVARRRVGIASFHLSGEAALVLF